MPPTRRIIKPHPRDNQLSPIPIDFDPETLGWVLDEGGRGYLMHLPAAPCRSLPLVLKIKNECVGNGSLLCVGNRFPPMGPPVGLFRVS